jgi:hypothetical protein
LLRREKVIAVSGMEILSGWLCEYMMYISMPDETCKILKTKRRHLTHEEMYNIERYSEKNNTVPISARWQYVHI